MPYRGSVDPALFHRESAGDFLDIQDLLIDPDNIYVFDFDGVVSSGQEDEVYRLEPFEEEYTLVQEILERFRIKCQGMVFNYQRHLAFQAAAWGMSVPIETGPGFAIAREVQRHSRLFFLTARSGWYAVERFRRFVAHHEFLPVETFHVGRVPKDRQIELLRKEFPEDKIVFLDDSASHLAAIHEVGLANIDLVQVTDQKRERLKREAKTWYLKIMSACREGRKYNDVRSECK